MSSSSGTAGVIAPPPLLFLAALALGIASDAVVPLGLLEAIPDGPRLAVAVPVAVAAVLLAVPGLLSFRRAGTAVEPWHPTTALVVDGIYDRIRNPMYAGLVLLLVAIAVATAGDWTALASVPLALVLHYGVVKREERYLAARFGEAYDRYVARVPRYGWRR